MKSAGMKQNDEHRRHKHRYRAALYSMKPGNEVIPPQNILSIQVLVSLSETSSFFQQWRQLCHTAKSAKWSKIDTKEGITVARCKFGRGSRGHAVIKIEGVLPADPCTVYQFLQLSTREGGKVRGRREGNREGGKEGEEED